MTTRYVDVLVVGAGPTGIGAATRLSEIKNGPSWEIREAEDRPGGLSRTDATDEGFLFDFGGHVVFSHHDYFDDLVRRSIGDFDDPEKWTTKSRRSYVFTKGRWIPYPFQSNLAALSESDRKIALDGYANRVVVDAPANFDEWTTSTMGEGVADLFARPYNRKVWATDPKDMDWRWVGERVAPVAESSSTWGPNATFRYPKIGGTGEIWRRAFEALPSDRKFLRSRLVAVDLEERVATFVDASDGTKDRVRYGRLIHSLHPFDFLSLTLRTKKYGLRCRELIDRCVRDTRTTRTTVVGLGFRSRSEEETDDGVCWCYFPDDDVVFHRATVLSNYSPHVVPPPEVELPTLKVVGSNESPPSDLRAGGSYSSLLLEISNEFGEPPRWIGKDADDVVVDDCVRGCVRTGLLMEGDEIVSISVARESNGYPVPTIERDAFMRDYESFFSGKDVYGRGRFGSFKYEIGNQDHAVEMGREIVDRVVFGDEERVFRGRGGKSYSVVMERSRGGLLALPLIDDDSFGVGDDVLPTETARLRGRSFPDVETFSAFVSERTSPSSDSRTGTRTGRRTATAT